ncbi:phage terminase large subunit family protein [Klebsiella variicola]|nr:phage terminase large subunit family protein [Klebsiella variicola]
MTFHIWTAYSPFTTWVQIVKEWIKTKGDTGKRKTFTNTTLGETGSRKLVNGLMPILSKSERSSLLPQCRIALSI